MLADQLNLRHGLKHFGLDAHDLKLVSGDPCSSFQGHRMHLIPNFVGVHMIGAIFALSKMYQPRGLTVPIALTFAQHLELLAPVRMENERERCKTLACDLVRIPPESKLFGSIFINIQNAR